MDEFDEDDNRISKTRVKREMQALQELGVALAQLSGEQLALIPMGDSLREALQAEGHIKTHSAIKRHRQYIGKLMRAEDSDAIAAAYESLQEQTRNEARRFQQLEYWRESLVNDSDGGIKAFLQQYPRTDRQQLNQLLRNCQREANADKQRIAKRRLFQFLRDTVARAESERE